MSEVTIDDLQTIVIKGDRTELIRVVGPLDSDQREKLVAGVLAIAKFTNRDWGPGGLEDSFKDDPNLAALRDGCTKQKYADWRVPRWTANLMALAICDRKVIEKPYEFDLNWLRSDLSDMPQRVLQILSDRRPAWLGKWIERELKQEFPVVSSFVERGLMRIGAIPANKDAGYYARISEYDKVLQYRDDSIKTDKLDVLYRSRYELLLADPELLENDIWKLFEIDSAAFRHALQEWGQALLKLSQEGILDRQRLLRQSLFGMGLPLSPSTLNGMGKFHEMLSPSIEERNTLVDDYLRLLAAHEPTVVGHSLAALEKLAKAKQLNATAFFRMFPEVFRIEKKTQPTTAIKLAKNLLKQSPDSFETAVAALLDGLQHPSIDVQKDVIETLATVKPKLSMEIADRLARLAGGVAVSLQSQVNQIIEEIHLARGSDDDTKTKGQSAKAATPAAVAKANSKMQKQSPSQPLPANGLDALRKRASLLPDAIQQSARIADAFARVDQNIELKVEKIENSRIPRCDPKTRIEPIASLDELIEVVSTVIERIDNVMELERILDGISRLHLEKPDDFDVRVAALRKRIASRLTGSGDTVLDQGLSIGFSQLLLTWLDLPELKRRESIHWFDMRGWFLRARITGLIDAVKSSRREAQEKRSYRDRKPVPTLALPTHRDGWIDPVVLVGRLNGHYANQHVLPDSFDLAQAILRLMPDGRSEALKLLGKADHYNGGLALRFALGDDCELKSYGGWGSDAFVAAAVRIRAAAQPEVSSVSSVARAWFDDAAVVRVEGAWMEEPTVPFALAEIAFSNDPHTFKAIPMNEQRHWISHWESLSNPNETVASCMVGHLQHLFDPEATWTFEACRLSIAAATHEAAETRIVAVDALAEAIGRSLVIPETLAQAFFCTLEQTKLNRVCKCFEDIASISPLHRYVIVRTIEVTLILVDELPKDAHLLLSTLLESAITLDVDVRLDLRQKFAELSGSSKTVKIAKQIAVLKHENSMQQQIDQLYLATLVARGERWAALNRH